MLSGTPRPTWLTFDCYGTLIQWDEGLKAAVHAMVKNKAGSIDSERLIAVYDRHEHRIEQAEPYRRFGNIAGEALAIALRELGSAATAADARTLTAAISAMPPFPEVVATLATLKAKGFRLCIISNTDDAIIAGNVAQLGGHIDRVVTAEQAGAYKPSPRIFDHAHRQIGVVRSEVVHICASPQLDLVATRALGLRAVWIDRGTGRQAPEGYVPDAVCPTLDGVLTVFSDAGWI